MADNGNFGFGKLVPGFDFLQSLAKGATDNVAGMPQLSSWVAPTLNVEELEKRIAELKAVHFWLDQNGKALSATIQALEVQKMTLATLKGMNVNMGQMADALTLKTTEAFEGMQKMAQAAGAAAQGGRARAGARQAPPAQEEQQEQQGQGASAPVDPLQWWGALTQQFQEIAANAMKDAASLSAAAPGGKAEAEAAPRATRTARKAPARKKSARQAKPG